MNQKTERRNLLINTITILLVDDDESVLKMTARLLKTLEFEVTPCASPKQALAECRSDKHFDLLITDLNMPEMNGLELAEKIREIDPQLPIIYFSGDDESTVQLTGKGKESYLQKPFGRNDLYYAITEFMSS